MGMGFGDSVTALLETYSNCLSLLRSLKHRKGKHDATKAEEQQITLLKSLKKDRALVEKAYSSRLSESGSRLKKGDARAISSLDRILRRIRITVAKMLRLSSKDPNPVLDYDSLMSLSNTSRIEAIKTIDNLSRRLGSGNSSRSSMAQAPAKSTSSKHKDRSSHSSSHPMPHSNTAEPRSRNKSPRSASNSPRKKRSSTKVKDEAQPKLKHESTVKVKIETPAKIVENDAPTRKQSPTVEFEIPPSPPPKHETNPQARPPGLAQRLAAAADNRVSFASFTTDSTKLGEIPERRARSRYYVAVPSGSDQYNVPPMYPLRPYKVEVKEKGFWGGLFGRRKED
ncbi:hypothetical protein OQA88_6188 [Cercophora sp. LCS_1]